MITEQEYLAALKIVKAYQNQINEQVSSAEATLLPKTIESLSISTRAKGAIFFCLPLGSRNWGIGTPTSNAIQHVTMEKLEGFRNIGPKTILEITNYFKEYGIEIK